MTDCIAAFICLFGAILVLTVPAGTVWVGLYRYRRSLGFPDWFSGILAQGVISTHKIGQGEGTFDDAIFLIIAVIGSNVLLGFTLLLAVLGLGMVIEAQEQTLTPTESTYATNVSPPSIVFSTPTNTLKPRPVGTGHIRLENYDWINVRSGPGQGYIVVEELTSIDEPFMILGYDNDRNWTNVRLRNGTEGWISEEHVILESTAHIILRGYEWIYVQSEPNIEAGEVGRIYSELEVFIIISHSRDSRWARVRLNDGTLGWISLEFVVLQ